MPEQPTIKKRLFRRLCLTESWVIFFILGITMMNYPFMVIFNKDIMVFNIPLLFLYFYVGWLISILVIYLFTKSISVCETDRKNRGEHR